MHPHALPAYMPVEFNDLIDEEFDTPDMGRPIGPKGIRKQATLLCDGMTWDDQLDDPDLTCEPQE